MEKLTFFKINPTENKLNILSKEISESRLKLLQNEVGGYVEKVYSFPTSDKFREESGISSFDLIVNEEGAIHELEPFLISWGELNRVVLYGCAVIVGATDCGEWVNVDPNWIIQNSPRVSFRRL